MTLSSKLTILLSGLTIAALLMAFSTPVINHKTKNSNDQCGLTNHTFQHGEKLVYKLYYQLGFIWVPAGEVIFSVKDVGNAYEMSAIGKTYSSYETIFKVNDYFYSKVDKSTMLPRNFVRIIEEGKYRLYDSISFDQKRNVAMTYHGKTKDSAKPQMHRLNNCMHDIVSNMYNIRNLETSTLKKGDQIGLDMFFDKEVYPVNIKYAGRETKDIKGLGDYKTIKMIPDLVSGNVFKEGDKMTMWVSDDRNKIPLMIESPVSVGSIKAVLKSYSGLKHELSSKIN
jgi:Protein of unknown function (DUF3108)